MIIQTQIEQKLIAAFAPQHLDISNESHMHAAAPSSKGGTGKGPRETHFRAVIVSAAFEGKRLLNQHQAVYAALGDTMGKIHALALHTYTPAEWQARGSAPASPECLGGSKHGGSKHDHA